MNNSGETDDDDGDDEDDDDDDGGCGCGGDGGGRGFTFAFWGFRLEGEFSCFFQGSLCFPKQINFRKNFKLPLTPVPLVLE